MRDPDLTGFELEYAELIGIDYREHVREIELRIRCPIVGWYYRSKLKSLAKALGIPKWVKVQDITYLITLKFSGVSALLETLLSQGHTIGNYDPSSRDWLQRLIFEIDDIRSTKLDESRSRFYIRAEGLILEFTYQDCLLLQSPLETTAIG